jgi:hypothetical protein
MSPVLPANVDIEMMDVADDQPTEGETASSLSPFHTEFYPGAAQILDGKGETFMNIFNKDEHAEKRERNLYYPFTTQDEWELASFLLKSDLSMAETDDYLRLQMVSDVARKSLCVLNSVSISDLDSTPSAIISDCT